MTDIKKNKNGKKRREKGGSSLFVGLLNRFWSFIYSLFIFALPGRALSGSDEYFKQSFIGGVLADGLLSGRRMKNRRSIAEIVTQSFVGRVIIKVRAALITMSVNVYAVFFAVFGATSVLAYYASLFIKDEYAFGIAGPVTGAIVAVSVVPVLTSSASVAEIIRSSKMWHAFVVDFLGVPEEKLEHTERTGGTAYMLWASFFGFLLGCLTYYFNPIIIPAVCAVFFLISLIASNPESGVVITVSALPFLRYIDNSDVMLVALIAITMISYFCKIKKRKRTRTVTPIGLLLMLYCVSLLVSGAFSDGGLRTFMDSLVNAVVIAGGYFLTFNLISSEKKLKVCVGILSVSLTLFSVIAIWNSYYEYISAGIIYNVGSRLGTIISQNPFYVADSVGVFGVFAVMITPTLVAKCFNRKRVYGVVALVFCILLVLTGTVLFGTYEAFVVLLIGICLYLVIYSHKTFTSMILLAIPAAMLIVIYPYISARFGADTSIISAIKGILPSASEESAIRVQLFSGVTEMIKDGNLTGIGSGTYAFQKSFGEYANAVTYAAEDPGNLYLLILCCSGVLGLFIFAAVVILLLRSGIGFLMRSEKGTLRTTALALLCGMISVLLFGMANSLWTDLNSIYLFWVCAGLLSGCVKMGREGFERKEAFCSETPTETEVRVKIGKQ